MAGSLAHQLSTLSARLFADQGGSVRLRQLPSSTARECTQGAVLRPREARTWLSLWVACAVLPRFSLETALDRSATRMTRMYSCCRSAMRSAWMALKLASLLRLSVSSRTMRSRSSHSWFCSSAKRWVDQLELVLQVRLARVDEWLSDGEGYRLQSRDLHLRLLGFSTKDKAAAA